MPILEIKARHCIQKNNTLSLKSLSCYDTFQYLDLWSSPTSYNNHGIIIPFGQVATGCKINSLFLREKKISGLRHNVNGWLNQLLVFLLWKCSVIVSAVFIVFISSDKTQIKWHICTSTKEFLVIEKIVSFVLKLITFNIFYRTKILSFYTEICKCNSFSSTVYTKGRFVSNKANK